METLTDKTIPIYRYWRKVGKATVLIDHTLSPDMYPELCETFNMIQDEPIWERKHWVFGFTGGQLRKIHKKIFKVPHWKEYWKTLKSVRVTKEYVLKKNIWFFRDQVIFYSTRHEILK